MAGLATLLRQLAQFFPPWVVAVILAVTLVFGWPWLMFSVRSKEIRGLMRRTVRATPPERQALIAQSFALAADKVDRLEVLGEAALAYHRPEVLAEVLGRIDRLSPGCEAAKALRLKSAPPPPPEATQTADHVAVIVKNLVEEGLVEMAREKLRLGLARFPGSPALVPLQELVESAAAHPPAEPAPDAPP